jgi:signal transduction histidine kinase
MAAVPLRSSQGVIGGLAFGYTRPSTFDDDDRGFLSAIAWQCAQALERAWLYETEHDARRAAEEASRAKSQFVAMMSHELRTPLSAIIGYQELLAEEISGPITEQQRQQLHRIRASATHLRDLINQILSLSRIEAGREEVAVDAVDLVSLVEDVAVLMEQEVEGAGLRFDVHLPGRPVEIETDAGKVRQILLNLISNAIKFTDEGAVEVRLETNGASARVIVRDTGIGIASEDRERIFDAFTQVDQSMTRQAGGSGLGLPVSRRLARLLGGDVSLESGPGQGSTFVLSLPL